MRNRRTTAGLTAVVACLVWTATADAKTFEVTRKNDPAPGKCKPNDCSLREAVLRANERAGKDEIVLPESKTYKLTRANPGGVPEDVGDFGDLDVNNDPLAITHPGRGRAKIRSQVADRVLHVQAGANTSFRKIVVTGGDAPVDGGGIFSQASLRFVRSAVVRNTAGNDGGGIDVQDLASVTMIRSQLSQNTSGDDGGGVNGADGNLVFRRSRVIGNDADDQGGGIRTTSDSNTTLLVQAVVSGNTAAAAGGVEVEGDAFRMLRSTVAGNRALTDDGGGIRADGVGDPLPLRIDSSTISGNRAATNGGGIALSESTLTSTNSTIVNNRADSRGGGISAIGPATEAGLNAVTVVRNTADFDDNEGIAAIGGGLFGDAADRFAVRNSIIALNLDAEVGNDCSGPDAVDSLDNNVISTDLGCSGFDGPNDRIRSNPKIGNLRDNGGPTKTVALQKGSGAIGNADKPSAPNRDQRGRKRDNNPDSGAFERGA